MFARFGAWFRVFVAEASGADLGRSASDEVLDVVVGNLAEAGTYLVAGRDGRPEMDAGGQARVATRLCSGLVGREGKGNVERQPEGEDVRR